MSTLGSLFDGSGGFPLAGALSGITPLWASEIEPYPIAVTTSRFPQMRHLGNVEEVDGRKIPPVDIITFGSPCQDMSVAGKRVGMKHRENGDDATTRSGLFYEAIRIIREMRESNNGRYPTFAIWENVPGAFSSNRGEDFRCVLEELAKICGCGGTIPRPANGKWRHAGEIVGDGYSIAWRLLDAQYWGVPQRRKRIYLVADFAGGSAGKILFERESVLGNPEPGEEARQGAAPGAESGAGTSGERVSAGGFCTEHSADSRSVGYEDERAPTLRAGVVPGVAIDFNPTDSRIQLKEDDLCQMLTARMGTGGNTVPMVFGISSDQSHAMLSENPHAGVYEADTSRTLDCSGGSPACNQGGMLVVAPAENPCYCIQGSMIGRKEQNGPQGDGINHEVAFTLDMVDRHAVYAMTTGSFTQLDEEKSPLLMARDYKDSPVVGKDEPVYALDRACFSAGENAQYSMNVGEEKAPTLVAAGPCAVAAPAAYLVRRLTPGECCRLQGFPDGWGVPKHKDAMDDCEAA